MRPALALSLLLSGAALAQRPPLTIDEALRTAREHHPLVRQAKAGTEAARAQEQGALSPLLPQVTGSASFQRSSINFVVPEDGLAAEFPEEDKDPRAVSFLHFGLGLHQLVYDFGQSTGYWQAARAHAKSEAQGERATLLQVDLAVRTAFINARSAKALVQVAREGLANQERHLALIERFVKLRERPDIELAQARSDRGNARFQLIVAENDFQNARAQLQLAMGAERPPEAELADEWLPPVSGEDGALESLVQEALAARPELGALSQQVRAEEWTMRAVEGGYGPSLSVSAGVSEAGFAVDRMAFNWGAGALLSWPLFEGGVTRAREAETRANLSGLQAQREELRQAVMAEVAQARASLHSGKAAIEAAEEALLHARERVRLAEKRYQEGEGDVMELTDARLALSMAEAQKVYAEYNLATARANLLYALGRM